MAVKTGRKRTSWVWNYFTYISKKCVECNMCNVTLASATTTNLKYHLNNIHEIYDDKDELIWKAETDNEIWKYFSKQDKYGAQCNVAECKTLVYNANKIYNVLEHLNKFHNDIIKAKQGEIAGTWLSSHFKNVGYYAVCKHCHCNINIFREANTLKHHLLSVHNINKYTRCKEETRVNNADGITQKFVDKGHFGFHDNVLRKSLLNQESQQGYIYI